MNNKIIYNTPMNQGRSMVYRLLSSLFAKELDHRLLLELQASQAQAFFAHLASDPLFTDDIATLNHELAQLTSDNALLELAADYCGLFLVGTKHSANPYASLYLHHDAQTEEVLLFGEHHQQLQAYLQQNQLAVQSEFPEPADHIAVILAYAAHQACNCDDKAQLDFIRQYLNAWLPSFTQKVASVDTGKFYAALTHLTHVWVASDCEALATQ